MRRIPNYPIREAVLSSEVTVAEICRRTGMIRYRPRDSKYDADSTTMRRRLGINISGGTYNKTIEEGLARKIAAAIDIDFHELYADVDFDEIVTQQCSRCNIGLVERSPVGLCGFCIEMRDIENGT